MEMFANWMEILAPSPAPKEALKVQVIETGSEVPLRSIDGQLFNCFILVPTKSTATPVARCKYILVITDTQIIEMYPHSSKAGIAVAAEVHELQALVKLKFKKGEEGILLLEYKNGKISKFLMSDPAVCVGHIKTKMRDMGMNGSIKNKHDKIIENAQHFFLEAKNIETQFSLSPSVEYVQEMMDLLRKSAEKFAEANDDSYHEVMVFIKKFLQRSDVNSVLDGTVSYPQIPHSDPEIAATSSIHSIISPNKPTVTPIDTITATDATAVENDSAAALYGADSFQTPPQTPPHSTATSTSTYHLTLPDVEAELHSLQNALTYQFDEEDHYTPHFPTTSTSATSVVTTDGATNASTTTLKPSEPCELTDLLDSMTNELDTLLHSFASSDDVTSTTTSTTNIHNDNNDSIAVNPTTETSADDSAFDVSDTEGFQELDFAQHLDDVMSPDKS